MSDKPVSRFPVPEINELPEDMRERILAVQEKSGFVPNVFLALAHRPDEFRAFFDYHDALMEKECGLTKGEREMIATNYRKADITPRQKAMLDFAVKVSLNVQEVNEADYEALHQHGFTDEDIWDIGAISGFFALSNRLANAMNIRPNDEFYLMGRIPKE